MGKDLKYDVFIRDEEMLFEQLKEGKLVFFQRSKTSGGGFWLVRTYPYYFEYVISYPVSLRQGIDVIIGIQAAQTETLLENENDHPYELISPPSA